MKPSILITNPLSGKYKRSRVFSLIKKLKNSGLKIEEIELKKDQEIKEIIDNLNPEDYDTLFLTFGDGTINSAINAIANRDDISKFKLFYIKSKGEEGQIYANTLKYLTGNVWSRSSTTSGATIYNVSDYIHFTNYDSTIGYNPETPDEARKNSVMYQNTLDTLITLADFERATLREPGVSNVRATDLTNDPRRNS